MSEEEKKDVFEYDIEGTIYVQQKMKLGQVKQLNEMFGKISLPANFNAISLFTVFGSRLADFMSIVLCEKGKKLKDKDRTALAAVFEDMADVDVGMKVINDFLDCNPIASYFENMMKVFQRFAQSKDSQ